MTIDDFKKTPFGAGMHGRYHGETYPITGVNFQEYLIELHSADSNDEPMWVRCENVEIVDV